MNSPLTLSKRWYLTLGEKRFRRELVVTVVILGLILFFFTKFLLFVQDRDGIVLPDPLLSLFQPVDLTWFIFSLIYLSLFVSLIFLLKSPQRLLSALQLYTLMVIVRIISMYLMPLDPPETMIPLQDPFVEFFGTGELLTKDLFFSGHTATLFILFLMSEKGMLKCILLISTFLVALFVIIQHVHYSIDILAAVFFTYSCYAWLRIYKNNFSRTSE